MSNPQIEAWSTALPQIDFPKIDHSRDEHSPWRIYAGARQALKVALVD
jgi:hypothetical protein